MKLSDRIEIILDEVEQKRATKRSEPQLFGKPYKEPKRYTFSKILCLFSNAALAVVLLLAIFSVCFYFYLCNKAMEHPEYAQVLPDLSFLSFIVPAAFVFTGLTHTFYYNKERFANCIKIRFEYIKQLLTFKLNSGMYTKEELQAEIDNEISTAQGEVENVISTTVTPLEQPQDNITL